MCLTDSVTDITLQRYPLTKDIDAIGLVELAKLVQNESVGGV